MTDVETLLAQIAEIGATEGTGVRRLAWTDEDARLAQWFAAACAERGLEVSTDRCGNQWAWWGDPDAELVLDTNSEDVAAESESTPEPEAEDADPEPADQSEQGEDSGDGADGEQADAASVEATVEAEVDDGEAAEVEAGDVEATVEGEDVGGPDVEAAVEAGRMESEAAADAVVVGESEGGAEPAESGLLADGTLPHGGIVTGSHLDSVPGGGRYDGPLGIATALAAIDELRAEGFTPRRALGLVRFVDEEGARFGVPCTGSRLLVGELEPADLLARADDDGVTYAEAAAKAGLDIDAMGRDDAVLQRVGAFVEVHVEQGFTLAAEEVDAPLGVCGLIRPHGRWRVEIHGHGDHAGTARFVDRMDPMIELARLISTVRNVASRQDALATVGKVEVHPNVPNAVPALVVAWIDIRADTQGQVKSVASEIRAVGFDLEQESWTPPTPFGGPLTDLVTQVAGEAAGVGPLPVLATGAGHDAGVLATAGVPAAMLFVRNPTGVSHAPEESVQPEDSALGVRSLAAVLADLCR